MRTLAWVILLQDSGVINSILRGVGFSPVKLIRTQTGVIIGMAQVLLPFMILPLYSVMKTIDLRLMQAARSLGAQPGARLSSGLPAALAAWRLCRRHHRLHPGARLLHHAGAAWRAALDHAVDADPEPGAEPAQLGARRRHGRRASGRHLRASGARRAADAPAAQDRGHGTDEACNARHPWSVAACSSQSGWWRRRFVVVPMSFNENKSLAFPPHGFSWQWYQNFFTNPEWSSSLFNSLKVAFSHRRVGDDSWHAGRLRARPHESRASGVLRMLLLTPMVVPGVVLAIGIYAVYLDTQSRRHPDRLRACPHHPCRCRSFLSPSRPASKSSTGGWKPQPPASAPAR